MRKSVKVFYCVLLYGDRCHSLSGTFWYTQSVVGLTDLGQFHRQPFADSTGSVIFVAVRHVIDAKNVNKNAYVRWAAVDKIQSSLSLGLAFDSDTTAFDIVATAVKVRPPENILHSLLNK